MRVKALAIRILRQLRHDHRTLALMLVAPLLVLTLVYFILEETDTPLSVAVTNVPVDDMRNLEDQNLRVILCSESEALEALEMGDVTAAIQMKSGQTSVQVDGTDQTKVTKVLAAIETSKLTELNHGQHRPDMDTKVHYVYGSEDYSMFDQFGSILIGFMVFFFVFLVAGISFLQERTMGTLEKLLSTPMKRYEIVAGYVLGFGVFTVAQSILISWYCIYVLNVVMVGSFVLVLLIVLFTAITALSLGIFISTAANNEFQMIQFIPIVIVPQFFFTGIFDLTPWMEFIGKFMPLYYVADALKTVMAKGGGFEEVRLDLLVILGFCMTFMIANTLLLKKYRKI